MIRLREFESGDAAALKKKQMPDAELSEIESMIRAWHTKTHGGKRFEMFAITERDAVVGSVSLYERSRSAASVGIEIFFDERGKGYAEEGMKRILARAKDLGYRLILDQVASDNQPSISLHEKLGFETGAYLYKKRRTARSFCICSVYKREKFLSPFSAWERLFASERDLRLTLCTASRGGNARRCGNRSALQALRGRRRAARSRRPSLCRVCGLRACRAVCALCRTR